MQRLVGIIRREEELVESLAEIDKLKERAKQLSVEGHRQYNPGWHLALDLANMLSSPSASRRRRWSGRSPAAGTPATTSRPRRRVGRGQPRAHPRAAGESGSVALKHQPLPVMPEELKELFDQ